MINTRIFIYGILVALICISGQICSAESSDITESGSSNLSLSVSFLDVDAAKAAIVDDSTDSYFDKLQQMEMSTKTGSPIEGATIEEQRANCRKRYQAGVREFTQAEKNMISQVVRSLYPILKEKYPLFANTPWSFIKVSNDVEGGIPFTRGRYIVLSEGTFKGFDMLHRIDPQQSTLSVAGLLIREQMYVFQRIHQEMFDSLYVQIWGFIKAESVESNPWLERHQLTNPNGPDSCWIYPVRREGNITYIQPLRVLSEGEGPKEMGKDARMIAVDLINQNGHFKPKVSEDGRPILYNLLEVVEYCNAFPSTRNVYHPNEISASLFTNIIMLDSLTVRSNLPVVRNKEVDKALEPLREWFAENLKPKQ